MKKSILAMVMMFALICSMFAGCANPGADATLPDNSDANQESTSATGESTGNSEETMNNNALPKNLKVLFIGNSATSNNDVPNILAFLAKKAGYNLAVSACTAGGYTLAQHADETTDHGQSVYERIANNKYDVVFLQDNCSCIKNEASRQAAKDACKKLNDAIVEAGGKTFIYVRPPYGYANAGYKPVEQCQELDKIFGEVAAEIGATNAYVNRAYAYAMENTDFELWGIDNAHTSVHGAYLVAYVMFATLFDTSATVLQADKLPAEDAKALQQIADKIVLEDHIPW